MSNKTNMMPHQLHDWVATERAKALHTQSKVTLPRLAAGDHLNHLKNPLRKNDQHIQPKSINHIKVTDSSRYKHKNQAREDTERQSIVMNDSTPKSSRLEKAEMIKDIKSWIKLLENLDETSSSLLDLSLPKLENSLYKWCLFIEQNVFCRQKLEYNLPLSHRTPSIKLHRNPEDTPRKMAESADLLLKQQREYYQNEIRKLSMRIQQTEEQIETNRVYNKQSLKRIAELQCLFHEWSGRVRREAVKERQETDAIDALLAKNEQFLYDIKQTITQGKESSAVVQKIQEKLEHLKVSKHHIQTAQ